MATRNKKIIIAIIAVIAIIFAVFVISQIAQRDALRNVEVNLDYVELDGLNLIVHLSMYNPNGITATLDRMDYEVYSGNTLIADGYVPYQYDIPPRSEISVPTDIDLSFTGIGKSILNKIFGNDTDLWLSATLYYDTPLGPIVYSFEYDI